MQLSPTRATFCRSTANVLSVSCTRACLRIWSALPGLVSCQSAPDGGQSVLPSIRDITSRWSGRYGRAIIPCTKAASRPLAASAANDNTGGPTTDTDAPLSILLGCMLMPQRVAPRIGYKSLNQDIFRRGMKFSPSRLLKKLRRVLPPSRLRVAQPPTGSPPATNSPSPPTTTGPPPAWVCGADGATNVRDTTREPSPPSSPTQDNMWREAFERDTIPVAPSNTHTPYSTSSTSSYGQVTDYSFGGASAPATESPCNACRCCSILRSIKQLQPRLELMIKIPELDSGAIFDQTSASPSTHSHTGSTADDEASVDEDYSAPANTVPSPLQRDDPADDYGPGLRRVPAGTDFPEFQRAPSPSELTAPTLATSEPRPKVSFVPFLCRSIPKDKIPEFQRAPSPGEFPAPPSPSGGQNVEEAYTSSRQLPTVGGSTLPHIAGPTSSLPPKQPLQLHELSQQPYPWADEARDPGFWPYGRVATQDVPHFFGIRTDLDPPFSFAPRAEDLLPLPPTPYPSSYVFDDPRSPGAGGTPVYDADADTGYPLVPSFPRRNEEDYPSVPWPEPTQCLEGKTLPPSLVECINGNPDRWQRFREIQLKEQMRERNRRKEAKKAKQSLIPKERTRLHQQATRLDGNTSQEPTHPPGLPHPSHLGPSFVASPNDPEYHPTMAQPLQPPIGSTTFRHPRVGLRSTQDALVVRRVIPDMFVRPKPVSRAYVSGLQRILGWQFTPEEEESFGANQAREDAEGWTRERVLKDWMGMAARRVEYWELF